MACFPDLGLQWSCACSHGFSDLLGRVGNVVIRPRFVFGVLEVDMMVRKNDSGPQNSQELNTLFKCPGATWNKREVSTSAVHGISDWALGHQGTCLWSLPTSLSGNASVNMSLLQLEGMPRNPAPLSIPCPCYVWACPLPGGWYIPAQTRDDR